MTGPLTLSGCALIPPPVQRRTTRPGPAHPSGTNGDDRGRDNGPLSDLPARNQLRRADRSGDAGYLRESRYPGHRVSGRPDRASASPTEAPQACDTVADPHRNPTDETAHSGTLVIRVKGTENSRSAASMRVSWAVGVFPGKCSQDDRTPEKRKVGSSTLPLTTRTSTGIPAPERGFRCSAYRYGSILPGVPGCAVLSVGYLWGGSGTRTCGIFVGYAGGLRRLM
jgi:hypothetical protein